MNTLQLSCIAFYGFWRFFDEYYFYKKSNVNDYLKFNYIKVVIMTYLLSITSKLFPFLIGLSVAISLIAGFVISLLPLPSEKIELNVQHALAQGLGKALFDSVLSLILFWVVSQ